MEKKIKELELDVIRAIGRIECYYNYAIGAKESDTGLAPPSQWNLEMDQQSMNAPSFIVMVGAVVHV